LGAIGEEARGECPKGFPVSTDINKGDHTDLENGSRLPVLARPDGLAINGHSARALARVGLPSPSPSHPFVAGLVIETKEIWEELVDSLKDLSVRLAFEVPEVPHDWSSFLERIDRLWPDVILLEVSKLREPLDEVVRRLRSTAAQPAVFALYPTASPDAILAALRAGVSEYLYPPSGFR
jgi:CheY-like chemotaxis protein